MCRLVIDLVQLLILSLVVSTEDIKRHNDIKPFRNLLDEIVRVNENRLIAMKKLNDLNDPTYRTPALRMGGERNNSLDEQGIDLDDKVLTVLVFDGATLTKKFENIKGSNSLTMKFDLRTGKKKGGAVPSFDKLNMTNCNLDFQQKAMLRKSWRSSCDRHAAKECKKACVAAYKSVCAKYSCRRRMKKSFKKECKKSCKNKFYYKDSDENDYDYFDDM